MRWRTFLEPAGNDVDSYVAVKVNDWEIELKIADCDRRIKLYFQPESERNRKTMLKKVAKLRTALDAVEAAVTGWQIHD